ncbi:MAG: bifunctional folylpolyglutamate synthase/dihydrofolate synthase [Chloroflexi bacterium]|nr:bifunctional folylpolyglutamate synthase/dihydrofolate synthase [Chloroflexota bacterium]
MSSRRGDGMSVVVEASDYHAAVSALQVRGRFGIRLGLGRTRALLGALGDPQRSLPGVLIGGTNGKGSVQAMVAAVLRAAGIRVGQTPKPHLVSYRERIVVDGRAIAPSDFAAVIREVLSAARSVPSRLGAPTEFELLTAAAFRWFADSAVRIAVIEVGLGGRLDATNAWDGGVAAITSVGLDHTEYLGDTTAEIGHEKAAIIKRGNVAVSGVTGGGASPIRTRARRLGVPLVEVAPLEVEAMDRAGITVRHPTHGPLRISLLGRHQALNAAVALATLDALERADLVHVTPEALRAGLSGVRWPGRLELLALERDGEAHLLARDPGAIDLLLDGAHNLDGARALADALDDLRPLLSAGRPTLLMGVLRDKDAAGMVQVLARSGALRSAHVVTTTVPDAPRSLSATDLASIWRGSPSEGASVLAVDDPSEALAVALAAARGAGGPLICCGSLYLVGAVRGQLVEDPELRDPPPPSREED